MSVNVTKRNPETGEIELNRTAGRIPPTFASWSDDFEIDENREFGLSSQVTKKLPAFY